LSETPRGYGQRFLLPIKWPRPFYRVQDRAGLGPLKTDANPNNLNRILPTKRRRHTPHFPTQGIHVFIIYMKIRSRLFFAGTELVAIYRTRVYGLTSLGWLLSAWAENVFLGLRSYCDGTADTDIWPASDEHSTIT